MAVTIPDLALALRVVTGSADPIEPAQRDLLSRLLGSSQAIVSVYASAGTPENVSDQAVILVASYLWDQPASARGMGFATSWINSGASALVEPWRVRRAGLLAGSGTGSPVVPPGGGIDRSAVLELIEEWAQRGNLDPIPESKLPNLQVGGGNVFSGASLPAPPVAMHIGWSQDREVSLAVFERVDNHPTDGASVGTTALSALPPFPPALAGDPSLYLHYWITGNPAVTGFLRYPGADPEDETDAFENVGPLAIDGVDGSVYVSRDRLLSGGAGDEIAVLIAGELIASESYVSRLIEAHRVVANAHHTPPIVTPGGGGSVGQVLALIANWAEEGNDQPIPRSKFPGNTLSGGTKVFFQAVEPYHFEDLLTDDLWFAPRGNSVEVYKWDRQEELFNLFYVFQLEASAVARSSGIAGAYVRRALVSVSQSVATGLEIKLNPDNLPAVPQLPEGFKIAFLVNTLNIPGFVHKYDSVRLQVGSRNIEPNAPDYNPPKTLVYADGRPIRRGTIRQFDYIEAVNRLNVWVAVVIRSQPPFLGPRAATDLARQMSLLPGQARLPYKALLGAPIVTNVTYPLPLQEMDRDMVSGRENPDTGVLDPHPLFAPYISRSFINSLGPSGSNTRIWAYLRLNEDDNPNDQFFLSKTDGLGDSGNATGEEIPFNTVLYTSQTGRVFYGALIEPANQQIPLKLYRRTVSLYDEVRRWTAGWAHEGSSAIIPAAKLPPIASAPVTGSIAYLGQIFTGGQDEGVGGRTLFESILNALTADRPKSLIITTSESGDPQQATNHVFEWSHAWHFPESVHYVNRVVSLYCYGPGSVNPVFLQFEDWGEFILQISVPNSQITVPWYFPAGSARRWRFYSRS